MFCTETNEIALGGFGQFLNADWQFVGDYTGVFGVTGVAYTSNLGQYLLSFEYVTLNYINLLGGTFAVGDTLTDSVTGATAVVVADNGVNAASCYITSSGLTFDPTDAFDNGGGVSAEVDTVSAPTIANGDVVIYNCLHYQATDITLLDGTTPDVNTSAYTLLPKSTANTGYVTEVDQIEFVFVDDWLQYRADKRGNTYRYSESIDTAVFGLGYTAINLFQWGRDAAHSYFVEESLCDILNALYPPERMVVTNGSQADQNIFNAGSFPTIIKVEDNSIFTSNTFNSGNFTEISIRNGTLGSCVFNTGFQNIHLTNAGVGNKTIDTSGVQNWFVNGLTLGFPETISNGESDITHQSGYSNAAREVDITGLTTLDLSATEEVGIYNLTSSNATETINLISNFPTLFPFTLKPETGLTVTITFTAVGSLSANDQIVGQSVFVVLNGDNGDELTLQAATFGAYSVTEQVELNQNN